MQVYIVTMEDTIVQIRDYAVLAESEDDAKTKIAQGIYLTEGAPETIDTTDSEPSRFRAIVGIDVDGKQL